MLCIHALKAHDSFGSFPSSLSTTSTTTATSIRSSSASLRGLLINYESLPGVVPRLVLPLFGVHEISSAYLHKMEEESSYYSKGRQRVRSFSGDSADKEERATHSIQQFSKLILSSTYNQLELNSFGSISKIAPSLLTRLLVSKEFESELSNNNNNNNNNNKAVMTGNSEAASSSASFNWKVLASFPAFAITNVTHAHIEHESSNVVIDRSQAAASAAAVSTSILEEPDQASIVPPFTIRIVSNSQQEQGHQSLNINNKNPTRSSDNRNVVATVDTVAPNALSVSSASSPHSHSVLPHEMIYEPWAPFANTHNSQAMAVMLIIIHRLHLLVGLIAILYYMFENLIR